MPVVTLSTGEVLATRKFVLATGQDGTGEWWMPDSIRALPRRQARLHLGDDIDFASPARRKVAVLAAASAMDNAATASEAGADVDLFPLPRRQPAAVQQPLAHLRGFHAPYRRDA